MVAGGIRRSMSRFLYGFLGGEAGQYDPVLTENNAIVGVPRQQGLLLP
jgi:hypothetical protein